MSDLLSGAVSIASGLSGLFGKKKKTPTVQQNMIAQAEGARQAAALHGFNPLTMLQYGNPQGTGLAAGGTPPLASVDMLVGGLQNIDDIVSGDKARRRAQDELNLDQAKLKLDQARSGVVSVPIGAVNTVAKGPSPLGQRPVQVQQSNGLTQPRLSFSQDHLKTSNPIASDREKDIEKLVNSPGVFEISNSLTGGPITLPGDGSPWGFDELLTAVTLGAPQAAHNWGGKAREYVNSWINSRHGGSPSMSIGGKQFALEPYTAKHKREKPKSRVPKSHSSIMPRIYD